MASKRKKTLADYPRLAAELGRARYPMLDPASIAHCSWNNFHWVCRKDATNRWRAPLANRGRQPKCPYCTGRLTDPRRPLGAFRDVKTA